MTNKWIGINLLLLIIVIIAGYQLYASMQQYEAQNSISNIEPAESGTSTEILPPSQPFDQYSPAEFTAISEKNLFSETRTKEESTDTPAANAALPASQKPLLVGVVISDKQKVATIMESGQRGQTGQTSILKIGDTYEGYTITEIESDHIVLDNGNQKSTLVLNDISQPAQNRNTAFIATRVVPIGGGAATISTTPITVGSVRTRTARSIPNRTAAQQQPASATSGNGNFIVPVAAGQSGNVPVPDTQQPQAGTVSQSSPQPEPDSGTSQGRTRILRTPFGEIMRNRQVPTQ